MDDSDDRFLEVGRTLTEILYRHGLTDDASLLDVGCSVGRLPIALLTFTGYGGHYTGFDVTPKQVSWARRTLTPVSANLRFRHLDVRNARYNPRGAVEPDDVRFPAKAESQDMACLFSIFTHFYRNDIQVYLHELRRVLKPGGTVVASWFVYDDERYDAAVSSIYPMIHRLDEHTIYSDQDDPLRAIAFHEDLIRSMVETAGLELELIERGTWAGGPGPDFQDIVVLRRPPLTTLQRLRRRAGATRRRVLR